MYSNIVLQAVAEKELGNAAYKQKKFEEAHAHYDKAIELDPKEISFLSNKAAVFFEQKVNRCHDSWAQERSN